ncbi:hypothetical protein H0H92_007301 [Tricholoma furcatifolium]|nr:hypothetical protein H0H92_007301 [Tricholoma furcatifolium]
MRKPVTKQQPTQNSSDDDLQTPTAHNHRPHPPATIGWLSTHDSNSIKWPLSASEPSPIHLTPSSRPRTTALNNKIPHNMPSRPENNTPDRWRLNNDNQFVDSQWDLAADIVRLKISEGATDVNDVHGQIRTPPKASIPSVTHITEGSPLETSSSTSAGSSPQASEHEISMSHSRGSSTDTTVSSSRESAGSVPSGPILVKPPLTINTGNEIKERPHSFSGGLSSAELRRLQQAGDASERQGPNAEQPSYPSITNHIHRPQPQPHPQMFDYRSDQSQLNQALVPDEFVPDYNAQQRGYPVAAPPGPPFVQGRPNSNITFPAYRQPPRGYQGVVPNPPGLPYSGHTAHLSLGNTQQLYDMMLPGSMEPHPAVARVQQQHNIYRPTHHHSASDPSAAMREATAMALMGSGIPPFAPPMFPAAVPTLPMYPNQFYPQEQYALPDAMNPVRLQAQYTGSYLPAQGPPEPVPTSPSTSGQGPSANNRKLGLYKTELCRSWEEKGTCRYGSKCQFAHGEDELRKVTRHPKTFWVSGTCPYGKRCCFIHTELPASGATPNGGATPTMDGVPQPQQGPDGRTRSMSTNSDPNEAPASLLVRISGKRVPEPNNLATPVDGNSFQFVRPPTGSLRVDTSALDTSSSKQNKSAYPTFASNGVMLPAPERKSQKSPAPVTAGPDLGRHNNARREIVGYNGTQRHKTTASTSSSVRHSSNGSEVDLTYTSSPSAAFPMSSTDGPTRHGHVRAGSAGNWGTFSRSSHLSQSPFAGESAGGAPWSSTELAVGTSRLHEKVWT